MHTMHVHSRQLPAKVWHHAELGAPGKACQYSRLVLALLDDVTALVQM